MKLLVTGGAGFIGSNFTRYWLTTHPDDDVVVLDALTYAGCRESLVDLEQQIRFVHGDIGNTTHVLEVLDRYAIDVVVNFAAESHNSLAIIDPERFFRTNVAGTVGLLEAARTYGGLTRFHHVSTCEVYGDLDLDAMDAFTEESPYRPRTPYNASKAGADHAVRAYALTYGLPISITNCANNYGPYQFPEKLIPLFTALALQDQPLPLYASKDNRREWIHVLDHARAIDLVIHEGRSGETYHVGTGDEFSIEEIADRILRELGKPGALKSTVPDRPSHDRRYLLNSSKIRAELSFTPSIEFDQGIRETIQWYRSHEQWWRPLMGRSPVQEMAAWQSRS
ncbi:MULTISPECIES: dTDP-glucose 4,6-dehydratase [Ferrimicrobium]|uniref:dTDP-glucose 4,6-dehydratase n=1 Tax=Ferrimicrobium TaxID=121038 RepID=UPI0023F47079|nr:MULTISPECIES: dTDP-glucose 4,6-dehydratase [Ferrimicrobium]